MKPTGTHCLDPFVPATGGNMACTPYERHASGATLITVHGTWAPKAPWAQPDSQLSTTLGEWFATRGMRATVEPFTWTGRNSIAARRAAGRDLARRVQAIRDQDSCGAIYLIVHSHGGSVVAYAAKQDPTLAHNIDGLIALATPWIGVRPCNYAGALDLMIRRLFLYLLFFSLLPFIPFLVKWVAIGLGWDPNQEFLSAISIAAWSLPTAGIFALLFFLTRHRLEQKMDSKAADRLRQLEVQATELDTTCAPLPPSVFFKPIGDEAALALTWTSAMADVMQSMSKLLFLSLQSAKDWWLKVPSCARRVAILTLTAFWYTGTLAAFIPHLSIMENQTVSIDLSFPKDVFSLPWHDAIASVLWSSAWLWTLFVWSVVLLGLGGLCMVMIIALLAAFAVGIASLKTALYMSIWIEAIPLGTHELILVDATTPSTAESPRLASSGLKHSALYNSPGTIAEVIKALTQFEEGRRTRKAAIEPPNTSGLND